MQIFGRFRSVKSVKNWRPKGDPIKGWVGFRNIAFKNRKILLEYRLLKESAVSREFDQAFRVGVTGCSIA